MVSDNISGDTVAIECVTIQPGPTIGTTAAITGSAVFGANGTVADTVTVNGTRGWTPHGQRPVLHVRALGLERHVLDPAL